MSNELGRTGKDCVIVALANYFHKPYDDVLKDCYTLCSTDFRTENHYLKGFRSDTYLAVFEKYTGRKAINIKGFKGSLITGLVRLQKSGRTTGHLVFCLLGVIQESNGKEYKLSEYRKLTGFTVKDVWF